jgi:HK97 family phage major capsid protein/HK97 family phage prohead protease
MNTQASKPATTLKPGTQLVRSFLVERSAINEETRTAELAFASESPYERWWGVEVLDCTATAMRMGRLSSGGPLLCDHDTKDHVGVIESVQLGADRVARAVVRFGKSARAEEVWRDVVDGIRRNVSVGYQIHQAVLVETKDDQDTYRVTDWEPYEVSLVSVPADASVGVGRSAAESPVIATSPQVTPQFIKESTVTTATPDVTPAAPVAAPAITSQDVRNAEAAARRTMLEMTAIGEQFSRFNGVALAKQAIEKGESVDQLRGQIMNAVTAAQTTQATNLDLSSKDQKRFSVFKAIRALTDKNWRGAEFELECHNEILKRTGLQEAIHGGFYMPMDIQKRDLTVATASAGGNLVATDLQSANFIDLLRARSVLAKLGATMLPGLVGNVAIPKLTGAATAYWLTNEATAITESQQTVGQLALAPKTLGAYTELSRQLMLQSTPAAEALVMNDLAKVLALAIDLAGLEGSGSSGQPTGISNTAGIGSVSGTSIALAGMIEFQTDTGAANALADGSAYLTTPTVAGLLMQRARFSNTDTPLWTGSVLEGQACGYRASTTTQMTAASMIFGDFSQVVIGEWSMLEIALNPYANFTAAITGIRAIQSVDVGIRQAAAFSRATSIT